MDLDATLKHSFSKTHQGEIMTPDLKEIAMKAVQDFRNGDEFFGDHQFEVTFPKGYLAGKFREWVENQCYDGTSLQAALMFSKISWSPARITQIESGNVNPSFVELLEWCNANPDLCEAVGILTWPLEHDKKVLGFALVENSGFVLDPDIELLGTFTDMDELRQFIAENFEG